MGASASASFQKLNAARDDDDVERDDYAGEGDVQDDDVEETEEEWRARRGETNLTRLDQLKRMLAIAFFAGLGIIVIVVAITQTPLLTANDDDVPAMNKTMSPTISLTHGGGR